MNYIFLIAVRSVVIATITVTVAHGVCSKTGELENWCGGGVFYECFNELVFFFTCFFQISKDPWHRSLVFVNVRRLASILEYIQVGSGKLS